MITLKKRAYKQYLERIKMRMERKDDMFDPNEVLLDDLTLDSEPNPDDDENEPGIGDEFHQDPKD